MTQKVQIQRILTNIFSLIREQEQLALPGIVGYVIFLTQPTLFLVTTPISCPCENKTAPYAFGWLSWRVSEISKLVGAAGHTPPGASHCSQPLIFVKSHTHSCYCTHNSLCVTFNTHSCYCARNSLCVTNNRIRQSFTPYFYCKSGRMCRTRDDRRPLWRYDTKCHGWL